MPFKKPDLDKLLKLADHLESKYHNPGKQRHSFIALLKQATEQARKLPPKQAYDLLFSLVTLEYELISTSEYKHWSPTGSDLFVLLSDYLGITKENPFSEYERLPYIHKAKKYLKTVYTDKDFKQLQSEYALVWQDKQALVKNADAIIKAHLAKYKLNLENLRKSLKDLEGLRDATAKLSTTYTGKRPLMKETMALLHDACIELHKPNPNNPDDDARQRETAAHRAVLFYQLLYNENRYKVFSPKGGVFGWYGGSSMYKIAREQLRKDIADFSEEEAKEMLATHVKLIDSITSSRYFLNNKTKEWDKNHGANKLSKTLTELRTETSKMLNEIENKKNSWNFKSMAVSATVGYGVQSVGKQALENAAKNAASYIGTTVLGVSGVAAGPIGMGISTGAGLLILGIGYFCRKTVLGRVITAGVGATVDVLSGAVGDRAADLFESFRGAKNGIFSLRENFKTTEEDEMFCDWVNTLLELDEEYISKEIKAEIREICHLKEGELLKPLTKVVYEPVAFFTDKSKGMPAAVHLDYNPQQEKEAEQEKKDLERAEDHGFLYRDRCNQEPKADMKGVSVIVIPDNDYSPSGTLRRP